MYYQFNLSKGLLHGTQTGPFVGFDRADGSVANVFPPTGRSFATPQVHRFRIVDDAIAEHDAVRDDLAMAGQVGWFPPRPSYVVRMLLARRRYRKPPTPETQRSRSRLLTEAGSMSGESPVCPERVPAGTSVARPP